MKLLKNPFRRLLQTSIKKKMLFLIVGLITITPTILISLLASAYYYYGIETLFNEKISKSLDETVKIAKLYLEEHNESIKSDILGIAQDIERNSALLQANPKNFEELWMKEAELRSITEAMVFTRDHHIVSKTFTSLSLYFEKIPNNVLDEAESGKVVVLDSQQGDDIIIRAVLKLHDFENAYLLIGRKVDEKILNHLRSTEGSQAQYKILLSDIGKTRFKLGLAFISLSALLCILAIILAIKIAKKIAKPINNLVSATAQIKEGNFAIRLPEMQGRDETAVLTRAFNQMAHHIELQTLELRNKNAIIDERRRFIETVLKEISAGLVVIDSKNNISLVNQSACNMLHKTSENLLGKSYLVIIPEIEEFIELSNKNPGEMINNNIILQQGNKEIHLLIRVSSDKYEDNTTRYIVTMDDMTTLISAQRNAAWGEVAKRIAHEIKNPLTPINLASERLLHKFSKQISTDRETFDKYLTTIISHVNGIGKIVEDFVEFARLSSPQLAKNDICKITNNVLVLQRAANPDIKFKINNLDNECFILCDKDQISQVLVNLIKNAVESINSKDLNTSKGEIAIKLKVTKSKAVLRIVDNGIGINDDLLNSIHEPYVTTKKNGTGLGLAIVKKIIEDHGGEIIIANNEKHGAHVILSFNLYIS